MKKILKTTQYLMKFVGSIIIVMDTRNWRYRTECHNADIGNSSFNFLETIKTYRYRQTVCTLCAVFVDWLYATIVSWIIDLRGDFERNKLTASYVSTLSTQTVWWPNGLRRLVISKPWLRYVSKIRESWLKLSALRHLRRATTVSTNHIAL